MLTRSKRKHIFVFLMIVPAVTLYVTFFLFPGAQSFQFSTFEWSGFNVDNIKHVGLKNFRVLAADNVFQRAMGNNLFFIFFGGTLNLGLSLLFATMFTGKSFPGRGLFRGIIFFPYTVSIVGIGLMWNFILNPNLGLLNGVLRNIGLEKLAIPWLGYRWPAMFSMTLISVWWSIGFYMTLLIAGINRIPLTFYEAAIIDGAGEIQKFRYITLPLLREVLIVCIMYLLMDGFKAFGVFYIMTQGGPNNLTHTMATYMIWVSVDYLSGAFRMGYGTAIAVVLFLLVATIALLYRILTRKAAVEF